MTSYPTPEFRRTALAPGLLGAIALIAGAALVGTGGFIWIQFAATILAAIVGVYAYQSGQWWWLIGLVPVIILWNPVVPLALDGPFWLAGQFVAAGLFIACGTLIRVPNPEDRNNRRR